MDLDCAHCGAHSPAGVDPSPGNMLFCIFCGGIAVWGMEGGWRNMTKDEHAAMLNNDSYLAAVDHLMVMRGLIEEDRANMVKVISARLRGCLYPWTSAEVVAHGVADSLIRSGFHSMHPEETPDVD